MTRYTPGDTITVSRRFYTSGALTSPTTVSLTYRQGKNGKKTTVTPTASQTGVYTAEIATDPDIVAPALHLRWTTTGPAGAYEEHVRLKRSAFTTLSGSDYG